MKKLETRTINKEDFAELSKETPIPCIVLEVSSEQTQLTAYGFMWPNGNAVVVSFKENALGRLHIGQSVLYQKLHGETRITPAEPTGAEELEQLKAARAEFLPKMYGN